jgi:hypothetical protein
MYSGILAAEAEEAPAPEPRPEVEPTAAGRIYAPTRRRKPRRLVFLEDELLEQLERQQALERKAAAEEGPAIDAAMADLERVNAAVARLEMAIAEEEAHLDDEEAMTIILRTIH